MRNHPVGAKYGWLGGWLWIAAVTLVLTALAGSAWADELEVKFKGMKAKLLQDLRSPTPAIRAAALEKFEQFPVPDAANTLLLQGSLTRYPDVRRGCLDVLRSYRNSEAVAKVLLADVLRDLKTSKGDDSTLVKLLVLLSAEEPAVKQMATEALNHLENSPRAVPVMIGVVDQLAESADAASARVLYNLADHSLATSHAGLKRALIQALCKVNEKEAVTRLVDSYVAAEGETRADIQRRLLQLSGLAPEAKTDWPTWWQENREKFVFPAAREKQEGLFAGAVRQSDNVPSYYGLPLYGSRIVFVIDYSGSMKGAKMEAAKRELQNAVAVLPDSTRFNIIAFHSQVIPWKRDLQIVTAQAKQQAAQWIASGEPTAKTNSYDSLEAALAQDCDAIYFLTDGAPTDGKVIDKQQIVALISRQNRIRRATINTLGIGVGAAGNSFDQFLKELAENNFGVYRRLD